MLFISEINQTSHETMTSNRCRFIFPPKGPGVRGALVTAFVETSTKTATSVKNRNGFVCQQLTRLPGRIKISSASWGSVTGYRLLPGRIMGLLVHLLRVSGEI